MTTFVFRHILALDFREERRIKSAASTPRLYVDRIIDQNNEKSMRTTPLLDVFEEENVKFSDPYVFTDATSLASDMPNEERRRRGGVFSSFLEPSLNNLFEEDCLIGMERVPSSSIDMILCDLPYGLTQNHWDSYIPLDLLWNQYCRIIKENGAIVLTSQGVFTAKLIMSRPELFKYKWVWEKSKPTNFLNAKKQPLRKHEDICVFYKKQPTYNPQMTAGIPYDKGVRKNQLSGSYGDFRPVRVASSGERYPTDVIYVKTAESEGEVVHPTQKPVELGRYLIRTYTNPGDVVLDNTFGSGSFLVAALLEGRNFIGFEKNEDVALFKKGDVDYIKVARQRLKRAWDSLEPRVKNCVELINLTREFEEAGSNVGRYSR